MPPTSRALALALTLTLAAPASARASNTSQTLDLAAFEDVADRATPIVGLVLAPVLCFFGLAWYAHVALALGFLGGGALFALGAFLLVESYSTAAVVFMLAAFAGGGALVGSILRLRPSACSFLVGGALGGAVALVTCCGVAGVSLESPLVPLTSITLLVLVGALFVRFERPTTLVWTSVLGAYWWLYGVGYFAGAFPTWRKLAAYMEDDEEQENEASAAAWSVYLVAFVALAAWSLREQWRREQRARRDAGGDGGRKDEQVASPRAEEDVQNAPFQRV